MAGTGPGDLFAQCQELLEACVDALDTIPVTSPGLGGAPERAFVSGGQPALDCCDQLTVHAANVREAPTAPLELGAGTRHRQDFRKNYVAFVVTITRCVHGPQQNGEPPLATDLEADAEQLDADAWAIWNYVWNLIRSGELFSLCSGVYFDSMSALTPSGLCGGWVFSLRAEMEGYEGL